VLRKPDFRFLFKRDIPSAPEWVNNLLEPFNQIIQFLIDAFNSNISVSNLSVQIIDFEFTAPFVETRFAKIKPEAVQAVFMANLSLPNGQPHGGNGGYDWREEGNSIVVSNIYSLSAGVKYKVKFFVMY